MTRRTFFASLVPSRWGSRPASAPASGTPACDTPLVAVIAGRHCLAYQGSFCSTCRERCPIPGAIVVERGLPRVNPALCDGCGICHDLCPAPVNAILMSVTQTSSLPSSPLQAGSLRYTDHA